MDDTSKVYVVQDDGTKNLSAALAWGSIVVLTQKDAPVYCVLDEYLQKLKTGLAYFNPEKDAMLLTGDPIAIGAALYHVLSKHGYAWCLKWDRQTKTYNHIKIDMNEGEKKNGNEQENSTS